MLYRYYEPEAGPLTAAFTASRVHPLVFPEVTVFQLSCSRKQGVPSAQEDYQAQFHKDYHKTAEEYDKEPPQEA